MFWILKEDYEKGKTGQVSDTVDRRGREGMNEPHYIWSLGSFW